MLNKILGNKRDSQAVKGEIEQLHGLILKFGAHRDELTGKITALKQQRTEELLGAAENEEVFSGSKLKRQIQDLLADIEELDAAAVATLARKRAAILEFHKLAAAEAAEEGAKSRTLRNELHDKFEKLKTQFEKEKVALERQISQANGNENTKMNESYRLAAFKFPTKYAFNGIDPGFSKDDPFGGILPWAFSDALRTMEQAERDEVARIGVTAPGDELVVSKTVLVDETGRVISAEVKPQIHHVTRFGDGFREQG